MSDDVLDRWEPVIGLEVHVQLATASKAFSSSAIAFGAPPNSLTDPVVLGLPGALPVFNRRALEHAVRLGLAVGATIRRRSRFARKHYFYPDSPKGYQISQYDEPLCEGGAIELVCGGQRRAVRLTRIHLEEDAGKNTHTAGTTSLVDLNRCGVPLVEVVSEPDVRSAEEAAEYMRALHALVRYLGISEADMEKGQMRCDANVSLRPRGATAYGTRAELKNINSFRFVQKAIEHEILRQARILDGGGTVVQETRLWDGAAGTSQSLRGKEEALDYRYFPDPDLPVLVVDDATIDGLRAGLPELPMARLDRLVALGLALDDARTLMVDRDLGDYFDAALQARGDAALQARGDAALAARGDAAAARSLANWLVGDLLGALNRDGRAVADSPVTPAGLAALVRLVDDDVISGKIAKDVLARAYASGEAPDAIVEREGLRQITDAGAIEALARQIVEANPKQAAQYRGGKDNLLGFFVGQLMKASGGKANPQLASELLRKLLAG
ncbi:MAG: Asp-tRNA(Asn)/Glu-tRNA(Gln) amidotransferase subunit GatB [Kofleriaceae bacterium]|nr:Asp-tRNA(Asn)/Glu-tRNA(Gln) amidotransferase subunit GatB [Kofleriaceae bacterium]MCB9574337.1 Asp-tRNA(Asn)/Glu-tRNA(Gln) amidotransferase subunit GatB [Kofleriaceae bacterium]